MALVICCPCGEPLECEHLEMVVALGCPKCGQQVTLEFEDDKGRRCRSIVTVMEGPQWVGERFVVPVGVPLRIGSELGNWLSLDDEQIDKTHCELRLTPKGSVVVEDRGSNGGTWIGGQRITRGQLADKQSFRIGGYRMRLDYELNDGTPKAAQVSALEQAGIPLPDLQKVLAEETTVNWLTTNRYHVARGLITVFAWLTGLYHCCFLYLDKQWPWYWACAVGVAMLAVLADLGRRVALLHPYMNYVSIGMLIAFAIADAIMAVPYPAAGALAVAGCLAALTIRIPTPSQAAVAIGIGTAAAIMMTVVAYEQAKGIVEKYVQW